jgi:hypothetical protein
MQTTVQRASLAGEAHTDGDAVPGGKARGSALWARSAHATPTAQRASAALPRLTDTPAD